MSEEVKGYHVIICPSCDGQGGHRVDTLERAPKRPGEHGPPRSGGYTASCWQCHGRKLLVEKGESTEVKVLKRALEIYKDVVHGCAIAPVLVPFVNSKLDRARQELLAKEASDDDG